MNKVLRAESTVTRGATRGATRVKVAIGKITPRLSRYTVLFYLQATAPILGLERPGKPMYNTAPFTIREQSADNR